MRFGIRCVVLGLAAAIACGAAFAQGDVIAERRAGMKRMADAMGALRAVAQGTGDPRAEVERIDGMLAWYRHEETLFPPGSDRGQTRALPVIWTDRAAFDREHAEVAAKLTALRAAAASGDRPAFAQAFQAVGAVCTSCHRAFRAPAS